MRNRRAATYRTDEPGRARPLLERLPGGRRLGGVFVVAAVIIGYWIATGYGPTFDLSRPAADGQAGDPVAPPEKRHSRGLRKPSRARGPPDRSGRGLPVHSM